MGSPLAEQLSRLLGSTLDGAVRAIEDLTEEELHALPFPTSNSIGVQAWHIFRTTDNLIQFAFYRDPTVWLAKNLDEAWGMPRNEQGTGMPLDDAQHMRFPSAAALADYGRAVREAVVPRVEAMDDEFLLGTTPARVMGQVTERRRSDTVGGVLVTHLNQHLGQIIVLRQLLGKPGEGGL
jgi:DinB superfamily